MTDENLRAVIVRVRDNYSRGDRAHCTQHRLPHFLRRPKRHSSDCRSAAAEEGAERAGLLGGGDHRWEKGNQFCAKRLVKMIGKNAAQFFVIL